MTTIDDDKAGSAQIKVRNSPRADGSHQAKQSAALEVMAPAKTAGAKMVAEMPDVGKQVKASKPAAPRPTKKKNPILKPAVTKTRCFAQRPVMRAQSSSAAVPKLSPTLQFPVMTGGASFAPLGASTGLLSRLWRWIRSRQVARSGARRLHVAATASLGEKRFVAVIQVDGLQFLVGGGATNVVLLAQLDARESFGDLLSEKKTACDTRSTFEQAEAQA